MTTVELRGLRILGHHGVGDSERAVAQPFELDLDVDLEESPAGSSDDLTDTVDYGLLVESAAGVVREQSFQLLEALAEAVAAALLAHAGVARVTVAVRKLRPPVPFDLQTAGVRITRSEN